MRHDFNMEMLYDLLNNVKELSDEDACVLADLADQCLDMATNILYKMGKKDAAYATLKAAREIVQPACDIAFMNSEIASNDFRLVN